MNAFKRPGKTGKVPVDGNIQLQEQAEDRAAFVLLFGREPADGESYELVQLRPGLSEARIVKR